MQHPRPVLPSQRYSPASDYSYEGHQDVVPTTRQPLGESTGNVQAHSLTTASALCYPHQLSPPIHSIPTPPILPTQALTSSYGTSLRGGRSLQRNVSLQESAMGYPRGSKNPIYAYKNFADYRSKVMQKELEKEQPTWPLWLEDAFLDALQLIPQMGRQKFSSKTVLYGRNMLITEYLWTYHWLLHPPAKGERIPVGKEREQWEKGHDGKWKPHPVYRTRKQVSSHIQVLKKFFETLVTFHFFFPGKKDARDEDKKLVKEEEDRESFKNNRVLISITDGRLPDERPNYEYFARLLNADNDVFLRPKQCFIYVSSSKVSLKEKHVTNEEGTNKKQITGHTVDGHCLNEADYPHLKLNESKDYKDLCRAGNRPSVLLHEYTRPLAQKESTSVKDVCNRWEARFPELKDKLVAALDDVNPSDERTSRCVVGPCDTFHFDVVLDLHATSKFPTGSELNGMVELAINRGDLHGHSWRSVTCVDKPEELHMGGGDQDQGEPEFWDRTDPINVVPPHRIGCPNNSNNASSAVRPARPCDCAGRGARDTIVVPFPAHSWANTFIKLAPYVTAEREKKERERATKEAGLPRGRAEHEAARIKKENEEAAAASPSGSHGKPRMPTPKDLLTQVAMYQEIWSKPKGELSADEGNSSTSTSTATATSRRTGWTRRAVILWTFMPVHENTDDKGKSVTVPAGTNWRFLTKMDPTSQYHQQHAYLSGPPQLVSRDAVMSPNPGYIHHVNASMHETFSAAAYDDASVASSASSSFSSAPALSGLTLPSHHHQRLTGLLDGFSGGLATPPPTATLHSNNGYGFDPSSNGTNHHGANNTSSADALSMQLSFLSSAAASEGATPTAATADSHHHHHHHHLLPTDDTAFLAGLDVADYLKDIAAAGLSDVAATTAAAAAASSLPPQGGSSWTTTTTPHADWALTTSPQDLEGVATTAHSMTSTTRGSLSTASTAWSSAAADHEYAAGEAPGDDACWAAWQATELARLTSAENVSVHWEEDDFLPAASDHALRGYQQQLLELQQHQQSPLLGRKRSRTESFEGDEGGEEGPGYRVASVRKLSHQHDTLALDELQRAPTAVMEEGGFL